MRARLKPIADQVVVVTGAGSRLGLEVARAAARAGAAVVMAGADEATLRQASEALNTAGGRTHPVVGDPGTAEGAERIARAAAARFGRFDSWIEAGGEADSLAHAARAAVRHFQGRAGAGALVGFGRSLAEDAREELKRGAGAIAATMIRLPRNLRPRDPVEAVVEAALYAAARPMGRLAVAQGGRRLTAASQAQQHRGLVLGVGLVAVAALATWLAREEIARAARPRIGRALRPLAIAYVRRRPVQAVRLIARHPRRALKMARALS